MRDWIMMLLGAVFGGMAVLALLALLQPRIANARGTICGPRPGIVDALRSKFGEEQNGIGVVNQATVFELYVSDEGSWTMLVTNTAGISCIVGSGVNWQAIAPRPRGSAS